MPAIKAFSLAVLKIFLIASSWNINKSWFVTASLQVISDSEILSFAKFNVHRNTSLWKDFIVSYKDQSESRLYFQKKPVDTKKGRWDLKILRHFTTCLALVMILSWVRSWICCHAMVSTRFSSFLCNNHQLGPCSEPMQAPLLRDHIDAGLVLNWKRL